MARSYKEEFNQAAVPQDRLANLRTEAANFDNEWRATFSIETSESLHQEEYDYLEGWHSVIAYQHFSSIEEGLDAYLNSLSGNSPKWLGFESQLHKSIQLLWKEGAHSPGFAMMILCAWSPSPIMTVMV